MTAMKTGSSTTASTPLTPTTVASSAADLAMPGSALARASVSPFQCPPGSQLGVMGGGQLGRMFVHAAQAAGYRVMVLEPDAASPAGAAANQHVVAAYDDAAALAQMAAQCAAVTTEFENVPAPALLQLQAHVPVAPPAHAVQVCQHRAREKALFIQAGVPCAPHALITSATDAMRPEHAALLPGLLKTVTLGYDGKGQVSVASLAELPAAFEALKRVPCVLEQRLPLLHEISVIVARGATGTATNASATTGTAPNPRADAQCVHLPVQQNLHRDGVLAVTQVPAPDVDANTQQQAVAAALQLAQTLNYVGVLCVEFFVLTDGRLVANEMAPRPHNSGHYSIDACDVSQFDLQLRCLAGLPLVQPRQHSAAVMLNLLGDLWWPAAAAPQAQPPQEPDWARVLALPGVHLHLYGKAEPRRGRKMGHLTVTAANAEGARQQALRAAAALGLPAF